MKDGAPYKRGLPDVPYTLRIIWTWLRHALIQGSRSLGGRLLYVLLGLSVVLLLIQVQEHEARLASRRMLLREGNLRAAQAAAETFRRSLHQLHYTQRLLAITTLSPRMAEDQVGAYVREVRDQYPGMASIQVIDPLGTIRFASPEVGFKNTVASEPFFQALSPSSPHVLEFIPGDPSQEARVRVTSLATGNDGLALGAVSMELYRTGLSEFLPSSEPQRSEILLDGQGRLVFATAEMASTVAVRLEALRGGPPGRTAAFLEFRAPGEGNVMATAVSVPETDWALVSLRQEDAALSPVNQDTRIAIFLTLAVLVTLAGAMVIVLRVSLRPLDRLSAAALRLGSDARRSGGSEVSLPPLAAEVREFERLVSAFNSMSADLEATHRQLRAAGAQLERANFDLQERVRARELELESEHQKVLRAERLSTLGLLSSAIAHDLRNPLNTIGLGVYWLQARLAQQSDQRVNAKLETIAAELRRSEQIIRTLLAFARTGEPERQAVDLNALADEVLAVIDPPPGISLSVDLQPDVPEVPADRAQLFQVLENLIRNAVQAMPEGGSVRVRTYLQGDLVGVDVADTGPGVSEELQASIFEPLVTTKSTGTGLGLALCKRIIDAHGGRITLDSRPGEGATFQIVLPLSVPVPRAEG